jgi:predicted ATPase
MITRLRVKGFKSLYDLDVTFSPLTVLFGANTSGKSNVLDVIQLLARSATAQNIMDVFEPPFRGSALSCFSRQDHNTSETMQFVVDLKLSPSILENQQAYYPPLSPEKEPCLRYYLDISQSNEGFCFVSRESFAVLGPNGRESCVLKPDKSDSEILTNFSSFATSTFLSRADNTPYIKSIQDELASWTVYALDSQAGLQHSGVFRQDAKLGMRGERLGSVLYQLKKTHPLRWETFQKALRLYIPEIDAVDVFLNDENEVGLYVYEGKKKISMRLLSNGTLNLLALLAISDVPFSQTVVGIDEPENSLHPSKMGLLARFLETQATDNQQLIVTTHSPYLLDHIPLESIYVCQKENSKTRVRPVTDVSVISCLSDDLLLSDLIVSGALNG